MMFKSNYNFYLVLLIILDSFVIFMQRLGSLEK